MKKISLFLAGMSLILVSSITFAVNTSLHHWICTTNASSSDADKEVNKRMAETKSAATAFAFAKKHCRDCTEITCKVQK